MLAFHLKPKTYSVSILYGNIANFRYLEVSLTPKSDGNLKNSKVHYWILPSFYSKPPGLSWIKRISFLTLRACQSETNDSFQNFLAAFNSLFIEVQESPNVISRKIILSRQNFTFSKKGRFS